MGFNDQTLTPYRGSEPYIFISYSHRNSGKAEEIISRMNRAGFRVWYDEGLIPGREWDENIARIIMGCSFFVALLSKEYLASSNCKDELNFARDKDKPILLIYLEDVVLPAGMELRLGRIFAVHRSRYSTEEAFYSKVFAAEGIACCNRRYRSDITQVSSKTASSRQVSRQPLVREVEPDADEPGSSALHVLGVVLLILLLLGAAWLLYRSILPKPPQPQVVTTPAIQTPVPTASNEAELDIEVTPSPDPTIIIAPEEEPATDIPDDSAPVSTPETVVEPVPELTPVPTPVPTPSPVDGSAFYSIPGGRTGQS